MRSPPLTAARPSSTSNVRNPQIEHIPSISKKSDAMLSWRRDALFSTAVPRIFCFFPRRRITSCSFFASRVPAGDGGYRLNAPGPAAPLLRSRRPHTLWPGLLSDSVRKSCYRPRRESGREGESGYRSAAVGVREPPKAESGCALFGIFPNSVFDVFPQRLNTEDADGFSYPDIESAVVSFGDHLPSCEAMNLRIEANRSRSRPRPDQCQEAECP